MGHLRTDFGSVDPEGSGGRVAVEAAKEGGEFKEGCDRRCFLRFFCVSCASPLSPELLLFVVCFFCLPCASSIGRVLLLFVLGIFCLSCASSVCPVFLLEFPPVGLCFLCLSFASFVCGEFLLMGVRFVSLSGASAVWPTRLQMVFATPAHINHGFADGLAHREGSPVCPELHLFDLCFSTLSGASRHRLSVIDFSCLCL